MGIEHLDMLIDHAREAASDLAEDGRHRYAARLESCADALARMRDERTARDAEMREERARVEAAESEVASLTARRATAEKAAHEWRERCEGMWSKEDVEVAWEAFFDTDSDSPPPSFADFSERVEAIEAGA